MGGGNDGEREKGGGGKGKRGSGGHKDTGEGD